MSKQPPVPENQRSDKGPAGSTDDNLQTGQPGNADVNLKQQGQTANTRQNTSNRARTQDR